MSTKKTIPANSPVRILKIGTCRTLTGKSKLTYHVGTLGEADVRFRIYDNDGGGFYGRDWVAATDIQRTLSKLPLVTSASLFPLFKSKSANSGGFMLAVLKHEGLFQRSTDNPRCYVATESPAFVSEIQKLILGGVDLDPDAVPGSKARAVRVSPGAKPKPVNPVKAAIKSPAAQAPWDRPAKAPAKSAKSVKTKA
ncbi:MULTISPECIES: hypothetical protein [unclassified Polaromonas]|uniref:hypothetical protein n=1 Tax=unclassified Polaromonas TaxID=2638319 RepID=UPI000F082BD4|nr:MULTISPECIES: hypothetical protein [unclassified Polaromonas]AYQ26908.1 hypothetical protein DT070_01970 [Polaromonas sp. SP1]QGJ18244.1 hypothetical protein F7R28_07455 [Polaromonas sp. Pch-P]